MELQGKEWRRGQEEVCRCGEGVGRVEEETKTDDLLQQQEQTDGGGASVEVCLDTSSLKLRFSFIILNI